MQAEREDELERLRRENEALKRKNGELLGIILNSRQYIRFEATIGYQQFMGRFGPAYSEALNDSVARRREADASGVQHPCEDGAGSD